MDDDLRGRLHRAANAHRPDRERMLARIERGMERGGAAPGLSRARRPAPPWLRVAGAASAVAGVLAAGGLGAAAVLQGGRPDPQTVATAPTTAAPPAGPAASPGPDRSAGTNAPAPRRTPQPSPPASSSSGTGAERDTPARGETTEPDSPETMEPARDLLRAAGAIDPGSSVYWAQSNVTVEVETQLTELVVELRVAPNGDPADTGNWRSLPAGDFDVEVRESDGALVYRWTLKDGRTVPPGRHVFAGQYDHAEGERDAGEDSYTVTAGSGDERGEWRGGFG
ncbi:hypothetical protein ACF08N_06185 [Streptomyces sp. NPDC015127]|uniref:hypothetical protein n=1 Tax=Streptomyces sp. NPDC015127 TaxID=3364939 RepID=UPI0036FAC995